MYHVYSATCIQIPSHAYIHRSFSNLKMANEEEALVDIELRVIETEETPSWKRKQSKRKACPVPDYCVDRSLYWNKMHAMECIF